MQNSFKPLFLLVSLFISFSCEAYFAKDSFDFYQNEEETKAMSIERTIDSFHRLYQWLVDKEYQVPPLNELVEEMIDYVHFCGVTLKEEWIEDLKQSLVLHIGEKAQSQPCLFKNRAHLESVLVKRKKESALPDHVTIGFCKALAGALLCIIPNPASQGVGTILIASGIQDMLKDPHTHSPHPDRFKHLPQES